MCRALLILTPDASPRSTISIPFAPNRTADKVLCELVRRLGDRHVKAGESGGRGDCAEGAVKKEGSAPFASPLDSWADGGLLRKEWLERHR